MEVEDFPIVHDPDPRDPEVTSEFTPPDVDLLLTPDALRSYRPPPPVTPPPAVRRPAPPTARPPARPQRSGGTLRFLQRPNVSAFYPAAARRNGIEGETVVLIEVAVTGRVERATVRRSSGYAVLDQAALRVAYAHVFQPGVAGRAALPVRFRLIG